MLNKGLRRKDVLADLKKIREQDKQYDDGKILCSMCTKPHPIAQKAHQLYLNSNLGDPGLFRGSVQLEKEVIKELATLLNGKNSVGFLVSGGTEANLLALLAAKNKANVNQPEVVLPESAHFSFTKICSLLNLKPVYADLDSSFKASSSTVKNCVNKNTVAIVGTAGTAELGIVDPIDELASIAMANNVWLHVDAAFGGLVIPFLKHANYKFDFSLEAVKSMTVDPHKMGMALIPTGGVIFRDRSALDLIKIETPYLTDRFQYTFVGTRTGASAASAWAVFHSLGIQGFRKVVDKCMKTTHFLYVALRNSGFTIVSEPTLNIVAFRNIQNTKQLAKKLWRRGWFVSYVPRYDCIRIVVMPHVKRRHAVAFVKDLSEIEKL